MKNLIIITLLVFSVVSLSAQKTKKQSRKEKKAAREAQQIEETKTALEHKAYVFSATQAIPSGMRSVNLTSSYEAKIENDTITCYLPFYGRAYSAAYGGSESPMDFTQPIENYKFEKTKKGYEVKFDVSNKNDRINFFFHIADTGSSSVTVTSTNRQSISYYGNLNKIKAEK